jgi:hypothetical protein
VSILHIFQVYLLRVSYWLVIHLLVTYLLANTILTETTNILKKTARQSSNCIHDAASSRNFTLNLHLKGLYEENITALLISQTQNVKLRMHLAIAYLHS